MVRGKALVRCGLVLLSLWLCIQSVPISVDQTKEKPPEEELGPPESAVSHMNNLTDTVSHLKLLYCYCKYTKYLSGCV